MIYHTLKFLASCLILQTALVAGRAISAPRHSIERNCTSHGTDAHVGINVLAILPGEVQQQASGPTLETSSHTRTHSHRDPHHSPTLLPNSATPGTVNIVAAMAVAPKVSSHTRTHSHRDPHHSPTLLPNSATTGTVNIVAAMAVAPKVQPPLTFVAAMAAKLKSQPTAATSGDSDQAAWQNGHDIVRATHGVGNLEWKEDLHLSALAIAKKCQGYHDHTSGHGENLAWGGDVDAKGASRMWAEEAPYFVMDSTKGFTTKQSIETGHFTQMIWEGTTGFGCAVFQCDAIKSEDGSQGSGGAMAVCEYDPPGNVILSGGGDAMQYYKANLHNV